MAEPEPPSNDHFEGQSPYEGRWIATIHGRVISQGGTPEQARQAAKASRFKETPLVSYMSTQPPIFIHSILEEIARLVPNDLPVYIVGGAVRDALTNTPVRDIDFTLPENAIKTARKVADALGGAFYPLDKERDYGRVILFQTDEQRLVLDFAPFQGDSLEDDLQGRDFTINAMAVDLHRPQELLDPLGGASDLYNRRLRSCSSEIFNTDPVRILRAIRFAIVLKMPSDPEIRERMRSAVPLLSQVSAERLRDELFILLDGPKPAAAFRSLDYLDALAHLLPELSRLKKLEQSPPHVFDVWEHTLGVVKKLAAVLSVLGLEFDEDNSANLSFGLISQRLGRYRSQLDIHLKDSLTQDRKLKPLLFLAALYHDVGKHSTKQVDLDGRIRFLDHENVGADLAVERAQALQLSNLEIERVRTIIRNHMRPLWLSQTGDPPSRKAIYRFFRDTGSAGVDICLLSLADTLATYGPTLPTELWAHQIDVIRSLLEAWWENREQAVYPPALIDGDDLMAEFGLKPGPTIGRLLEGIKEAQANGSVSNRHQAIELASELLNNPENQQVK